MVCASAPHTPVILRLNVITFKTTIGVAIHFIKKSLYFILKKGYKIISNSAMYINQMLSALITVKKPLLKSDVSSFITP